MLHPQSTYHVTQQIRAYDMESLIGDAGGYMGLFLGYAILHMPTLFTAVTRKVQEMMLKMKNSAQ